MFGKNRKIDSLENTAYSARKKIMNDVVSRIEPLKSETVYKKERPIKSHAYNLTRFIFVGNFAGKKKMAVFALAAVLIVSGAWLFLEKFSWLTLKITPHQEFLKEEVILKGKKDGLSADRQSLFDFPVETIGFKITEKDFRPATGEEEIKEKARGQIVIYNAFSSENQVLVKRTRFETPDGKIYRIPGQITVPGAEIKDGKIIPSSVEAEVFADQPGEEYNIGLADFTIPGFKGTARYSKFYARSKTSMEGGFTGTARVVSDKDAEEAKISLKNKLAEKINQEYKKQIPEDLILLEGASEISYEEAVFTPTIGKKSDNLATDLTANFNGILIKKEYFSKALVKAYLGLDSINSAAVANLDQINKNVISRDFEKGEIVLKINNVHLAWHFDELGLKNDLLAKDEPFNEIFKVYDKIERAELIFWPSWWRKIPNSADRIKIKIIFDSF